MAKLKFTKDWFSLLRKYTQSRAPQEGGFQIAKPDYRSYETQKECNDFLGAFLCCAEELQDIIWLDGNGGVKQ